MQHLTRTIQCKTADNETAIPFVINASTNAVLKSIQSKPTKKTKSLLLPWINQLLNLLDLASVGQPPSMLVQPPIIMMELLLLFLLRLLLLSLFSSLLPCC